MIAKVSINFLNDDTDPELLVDTDRVLTLMTGNAVYVTPDPTLAAVTASRTLFQGTVNALNGGTEATAARDAQRKVFAGLVRDLAAYVQKACGGDMVKLLSSGFPAQKDRQPVNGDLSAPGNLRLTRSGMSGQMKARCTPVDNATGYQWRWALSTAPTVFTMVEPPTTAANVLIENLTPGTVYVVQVRATGTKGRMSDWSDPAVLMAV